MTDYVYRVTKEIYGRPKIKVCTANSLVQQIAYIKNLILWSAKYNRALPRYNRILKIERAAIDNWEEVTENDWKSSS